MEASACGRAYAAVVRNQREYGVLSLDTLIVDERKLQKLAAEYESAPLETVLRVAIEHIPNLAFACSFGAEDMVLLDTLMRMEADINVFYLDTDVLFPETYKLIETSMKKYRIKNLTRIPADMSLMQQAETYGAELWRHNPSLCCQIRKVSPLSQHLSRFDGWITGIRRDQAPTRAKAQVFEADKKFHLVKVNPLVLWTDEDVWDSIAQNDVPYNPMHDRSYPSIGCLHCTKPVAAGEDPRSGRWSGLVKTECGLHK